MDEPSFSTPAFGYVLKIVTNRSDCGNGSGRSRMELITAKIARLAPRQIATVASAVTVNAGFLINCRKASRRLLITKGDHWIDAGRAPRRNEARRRRNESE